MHVQRLVTASSGQEVGARQTISSSSDGDGETSVRTAEVRRINDDDARREYRHTWLLYRTSAFGRECGNLGTDRRGRKTVGVQGEVVVGPVAAVGCGEA